MATSPESFAQTPSSPSAEAAVFSIPSVPSRALAAIIDYLVFFAFSLATLGFALSETASILASLLFGLLYYGVGNCSILQGQTLGKRVFGLRTLSWSAGSTGTAYLSLGQSSARYVLLFGFIAVVQEGTGSLYRSLGIAAPAFLLELPMLFAMAWFFTTIALVVFSSWHRGLHDLCCGSIVLRTIAPPSADSLKIFLAAQASGSSTLSALSSSGARLHQLLPIVTGLVLAFLFWLPGIGGTPAERFLREHLYQLEHSFPLRIISVQQKNAVLDIRCGLGDEASNTEASLTELALQIARQLQGLRPPFDQETVLSFRFFARSQLMPDENQRDRVYSVSWRDLSVRQEEASVGD